MTYDLVLYILQVLCLGWVGELLLQLLDGLLRPFDLAGTFLLRPLEGVQLVLELLSVLIL